MSLVLTVSSPTLQVIRATDLAVVHLTALASDSSTLSRRWVSLTYDWGDGSIPVETHNVASSSGVGVSEEHHYSPGTYTLVIEAFNYQYPVPEKKALSIGVFVTSSDVVQDAILYGPILPLDNAHPNKEEWALDRGEDLKVLVSSVKMLCLTARGERLMRPEYGTSLRRSLFEFNDAALTDAITTDITLSLATHEPRVALRSVAVTKGDRDVKLDLLCESVLTGRTFPVNLQF